MVFLAGLCTIDFPLLHLPISTSNPILVYLHKICLPYFQGQAVHTDLCNATEASVLFCIQRFYKPFNPNVRHFLTGLCRQRVIQAGGHKAEVTHIVRHLFAIHIQYEVRVVQTTVPSPTAFTTPMMQRPTSPRYSTCQLRV